MKCIFTGGSFKIIPASSQGYYLGVSEVGAAAGRNRGLSFRICRFQSAEKLFLELAHGLRLKNHAEDCHFPNQSSRGDKCMFYRPSKTIDVSLLVVKEKLMLDRLPQLPRPIGCRTPVTSVRAKLKNNSQHASSGASPPLPPVQSSQESCSSPKPSQNVLDFDSPEHVAGKAAFNKMARVNVVDPPEDVEPPSIPTSADEEVDTLVPPVSEMNEVLPVVQGASGQSPAYTRSKGKKAGASTLSTRAINIQSPNPKAYKRTTTADKGSQKQTRGKVDQASVSTDDPLVKLHDPGVASGTPRKNHG